MLILCARAWSSQNPGSLIADSSSARRSFRRAGSKVITDPGKLGPDLLELVGQRYELVGHGESMLPVAYCPWQRLYFLPEPHQQGSLRPMLSCSDLTTGCGAT